MSQEEYKQQETLLYSEYLAKLELIQQEWLKTNAKFSIGDLIYNVTGIIKVHKVSCEVFMNELQVVYHGLKYWKHKGQYVRTKDKNITVFRSNNHRKILL